MARSKKTTKPVLLPPVPRKVTITPTGLEVRQELSFEEWRGLAPMLGDAVRRMAFVIGDWLVYGEDQFQKGTLGKRVMTAVYDAATGATGLDRATLQNYAYVARKVAKERRIAHLSWEHHKVVARLKAAEQTRWLAQARGDGTKRAVSTMRLRKSILVGRLLSVEEALPDPLDRGIYNHIPFVNRLCAWWSWMQQRRWLETATDEQRMAVMRDLRPLVDIYHALNPRRTPQGGKSA